MLAANAGLLACGAAEPFTVALALHQMLLPLSAWRLLHALQTGSAARPQARPLAAATARADVVATRQMAESMRCPAFDAMAAMQTVRLSPRAASLRDLKHHRASRRLGYPRHTLQTV